MNNSSIPDVLSRLSRGTTEIINQEDLKRKLETSRKRGVPLRIKAGFDPTAPDLHLGHTVLLRKLRLFQDFGHEVYFLIGDFTAQVGDPTGRDQLRPKMDEQAIQANAKTYERQVFKILDPKKTRVVFNSQWLSRLSAKEILELSAHSSVAQMLARADFKKRFEEGREISLLEFFYPLLQGYDSVFLKADVELGGSDQKFNLLMGRQIQESQGQSPQVVLMTPLLEGTDGVKKMSKSLGNYIGINEPPDEMFGKIMSISDDLMVRYYEVLTDHDLAVIRGLHPKEAKLRLAQQIVGEFHGAESGEQARQEFEKIFSQKELPEEMAEFVLSAGNALKITDILVQAKVVESKREVRRLLQQGAIVFEGQRLSDENWIPQPGVLKVGKRRFLRIV